MQKFKVVFGIFKDTEFNGEHHIINGRVVILNLDTISQSYPANNCMPACKHKWIRSTKMYKPIRVCSECGDTQFVNKNDEEISSSTNTIST